MSVSLMIFRDQKSTRLRPCRSLALDFTRAIFQLWIHLDVGEWRRLAIFYRRTWGQSNEDADRIRVPGRMETLTSAAS
jgi:hypothetical protein